MYRPGYDAFDPDDPAHLYNMARAGGSRRIQRFDEFFRCYPLAMAPGAERPELNYGSKMFLPPSALEKLSRLHVQWPLTMELVNGGAPGGTPRHSHAGVLEFVAEEGRAYLPHWMMITLGLDVGDMLQVRSTSLSPARMVKLQPQSVAFLDISDPKAVLEKAFRNFATLTKGDVFSFEYNDEIYDVAVLEVKPESEKSGVSMVETDVSVEFAPPVGYVEPERRPAGTAAGSGSSTPRNGRGAGAGGLPAGGLVHSHGTMAQSINYDAIAPNSDTAAAGARAVASRFVSEGHKLNAKKTSGSSKSSTPKNKPSTPTPGATSNSSTSASASTSSASAVNPGGAATSVRQPGQPMPLRLPPNKLFLGYAVTPVKTDADREVEKENMLRPHFAGQGQTLRGGAVKRKSEGSEEKAKKPEEGRRLDGRKV